MSLDRRRLLHLAAAAALPAFPRVARAQRYPTRQITLVVPFAAGGIADAVARLTAPKLSERLGKAVVIENRAGAGGNLGARMVAGSAPDGYTLLATTSALAVNDSASRNKGYATEDLRAIAIVADSPDILAVHPSNPARSLQEFIASAKDKSFTFASAGTGTGPHIGAEYFFREIAKVKALHVPFGGGAPAVTAAVGNHVDAVWIVLPTVTPHVAQGGLRGLALASHTRNPAVPDVPTFAEQGFPGFSTGSWVGFFAPARTPDAVVTALNAEINAILGQAEAQERFRALGFDLVIRNAPAAAARFQRDLADWGKMVRAVGIMTD
jgi:tripartite-type tricarboxylate transporter receptor subunit TctC